MQDWQFEALEIRVLATDEQVRAINEQEIACDKDH